jgi:hypothetical protein
LLIVFLLAIVTAVVVASELLIVAPAPALAAGDTVTLSLVNGPTFTYGGTAPNFTAVVTFGTKPTANYGWTIAVKLDTGQTFGSGSGPTPSQDGMTLTFTRIIAYAPVDAGQRTAIASFYNIGTGETAYSSPMSFTVNKASLPLACTVSNQDGGVHFLGVGETLPVQMTPLSDDSQLPAEWTQGTFTVTFDGPTHVAYTNLTMGSDFVISLKAPAQSGLYSLSCAFSGSADYTPQTFTDHIQYTVSLRHALGSAQLFTNPTTLQPGTTDFYLVLHAAPGLPAPTGEFQFLVGKYYTRSIPLSASGDCRISISGIQSMAGITRITMRYWGDVHYNIVSMNFPLTTPPIPGRASSGGSGNVTGGSGSHATPTTTATETVTATETPGDELATPTAVGAGAVVTSTPTNSSDNTGLIVIVVVALLLLAGAGTVAGVLIYRARWASALANTQESYGYPAGGYSQAGQAGQYWDGGQPGGYGGYGGATSDDVTHPYAPDD